jgi:hypothetical protein
MLGTTRLATKVDYTATHVDQIDGTCLIGKEMRAQFAPSKISVRKRPYDKGQSPLTPNRDDASCPSSFRIDFFCGCDVRY